MSMTRATEDDSNRGDEANEDNDESDSGDEANTNNAYGEEDLNLDCATENLLDRVYEAVRDGRSPYELQRDGWYMDHIHEAVGIWYELGAFARSKEKGISPAQGFEEVAWQQRTF